MHLVRRSLSVVAGIFLLTGVAVCQESIPEGTILPVRLDSSLGSNTKPGKKITGTIMQNVPLPNGKSIHAGTKVTGHVMRANSASQGVQSEISFRFDEIALSKHAIPITTDLRALAGFVAVDDAQVPTMGADRGTPPEAYVTQQIGGDVVYRGGGSVEEDGKTVGKPVYDGVLSEVRSNGTPCSDGPGNNRMQALWVFSADACGTYGLRGTSIAHAGRSNPVGEITLQADKRQLRVSSGAGMLLRVIANKPAEQASDS
jgi:hypothetical protein